MVRVRQRLTVVQHRYARRRDVGVGDAWTRRRGVRRLARGVNLANPRQEALLRYVILAAVPRLQQRIGHGQQYRGGEQQRRQSERYRTHAFWSSGHPIKACARTKRWIAIVLRVLCCVYYVVIS